jgi:hypothetical protein
MSLPICERLRHLEKRSFYGRPTRQGCPGHSVGPDAAALIEELYGAGEAIEAWVKDLGGFAEDGTQPALVFQRLSAALAKAREEAA